MHKIIKTSSFFNNIKSTELIFQMYLIFASIFPQEILIYVPSRDPYFCFCLLQRIIFFSVKYCLYMQENSFNISKYFQSFIRPHDDFFCTFQATIIIFSVHSSLIFYVFYFYFFFFLVLWVLQNIFCFL